MLTATVPGTAAVSLDAGCWLPPWVAELFDDGPITGAVEAPSEGLLVRTSRVVKASGPRWLLASGTVLGAADLCDVELRRRTRELYRALRRAVDRAPWSLVRCWNFIPQINGRANAGLDRYMVFNAGRYEALREWFEAPDAFARSLPTATGVGHDGGDLHTFCLACDRPSQPVENPRQRPAYRYSNRFGPRPPCFARATMVQLDDRVRLMIGGTAAVRGEESLYPGCLESQLAETFANLDALVERASGGTALLAEAARELRIYFRRTADEAELAHLVTARLPALHRLELVRAAICRPELLVEIEGLATFPRRPPMRPLS